MFITLVKFFIGFPIDDDILEDDEVLSKIRITYQERHNFLFMTILLLYFMLVVIYFISSQIY